jgi:hypothetical protein
MIPRWDSKETFVSRLAYLKSVLKKNWFWFYLKSSLFCILVSIFECLTVFRLTVGTILCWAKIPGLFKSIKIADNNSYRSSSVFNDSHEN